jgi:hypothetical protein
MSAASGITKAVHFVVFTEGGIALTTLTVQEHCDVPANVPALVEDPSGQLRIGVLELPQRVPLCPL